MSGHSKQVAITLIFGKQFHFQFLFYCSVMHWHCDNEKGWHIHKGVWIYINACGLECTKGSQPFKINMDFISGQSAIVSRTHFLVLQDMLRGILHHVVDKHEWLDGECQHGEIPVESQKAWLTPDSPAHIGLRKVVLDTRFLHTLVHYTKFR